MNKPHILTAIPRNRYRLGEFTVTVLDEIESDDAVEYRYVAAVVRTGQMDPGLYVISVRNQNTIESGSHALWVIMRDGSQCVGIADHWSDLQEFTAAAIESIRQILNLQDEAPLKLL